MAIPEKPESECSSVQIDLCGEAKKIVLAKKRELKSMGLPASNELAILKIILGK